MATKIFVSGFYDIIHAGHIQFFREARSLGDFLIVSFASEQVLWKSKRRKPSIPDGHKKVILESLCMVDKVVCGEHLEPGMDFEHVFLKERPDILAVTEDDCYGDLKRELCARIGARYVVLPKTPPCSEQISTTQLVNRIKAPLSVPLRVDFAGGWLDVPRHARQGAYIVNCAISPFVSLDHWPYELRSGLGGSGAWAMLQGRDPVQSELAKSTGDFLAGKMAVFHTGHDHDTPGMADGCRDYARIAQSSLIARAGVMERSIHELAAGVALYHSVQLQEGMAPLPTLGKELAKKYLGGGFGGYALYLFASREDRDEAVRLHDGMRAVEPYCKSPF